MLIRSVRSLFRLARRTVSGCAAAWMPWDKLEQSISNAALGGDDSADVPLLVIS